MFSKKWKKPVAILMAGALMLGLPACGKKKSEVSEGNGDTSTETSVAADGEEFDVYSDRIKSKTEELNKFLEYYYFDEDPAKQEEKYFDGIMAGLNDPYSVYYTPEEYARMLEDDSGTYFGIGATVSKNVETGAVYIVKPIKGSPAYESGLLPGDVFVKIDDTDITSDMELEEVVGLIRGSRDTVAHLTMYREGEDDFLEFTVKRADINNVTVEYEMLEGDIGYIEVSQFIENTPDQFIEAVDDLTGQGAKALIVDLRSNPGGLLDAVVEMVDYIVDDNVTVEGADSAGLIMTTKDKNGKVLEKFNCSDGHKVDLPMAVLVNENSASASETYTGVMKDYGLATIVGTNTYGKGIVQTIVRLSDGSGIKFTIAKYFTPAGNDIHEKGIAPDVEIELDESLYQMLEIPHDKDNQLQAAIKEVTK